MGTIRMLAGTVMLFAFTGVGQSAQKVQSYALTGTDEIVAWKLKVEPAEYKGRKALRVLKDSFGEGIAFVKGTDFQDGTIEMDLAVKVTAGTADSKTPGFIGIAFRTRADGSHYDLFYLRPGLSQSEDQAMRNHSVQYTATPDFGWDKLRYEWPAVYESYGDLQLETWTKVKIQVSGRS